jgi:hypothetical protein
VLSNIDLRLRIEQGPAGAAWTRTGPHSGLDWVIVGGESGPRARPMHPDWPRSLRDQCVSASVPFFMKQASGPRSGQQGNLPDDLWTTKEYPTSSTADSDDDGRHRQGERCDNEQGGAMLRSKAARQKDPQC